MRVTSRTIQSRARPKAKTTTWRRRSDNPDTADPPASEPASASSDLKKTSNKQPTVRRPVRQETSEHAKEMLADADAARRVYDRKQRNLVQDFANIQWFAGPEGPVQCRNPEYCGCTHSMFWCHTCGDGYCLSCRQTGAACNHDPCNFSSEFNEAFLPESVGAPGSSIDLAEFVQETIDQYAYFGSTRDAQSDYRREAFDDMLWRAEEGTDVHRNSYLKAFPREGVSDFPFADFVYLPRRDVGRVPFVAQHFLDMQDPEPLPIWRPEIFVNCRYTDLTDEECIQLLELYRSVLIPRKTIEAGNFRSPETCNYNQRESYHVTLLNWNLGSISRQPVIGGNVRFPKHIRDDP